MVSMKLVLEPRQVLLCSHCDRPFGEEHDKSDCPRAQIARLAQTRREYPCPVCAKRGDRGRVEVNAVDYFECRECHTQFSASETVCGEDPDTLDTAHLLDTTYENRAIKVLVMKNPGEGKFKVDLAIQKIKSYYKLGDDDDDTE